jgi:hypothetical protein
MAPLGRDACRKVAVPRTINPLSIRPLEHEGRYRANGRIVKPRECGREPVWHYLGVVVEKFDNLARAIAYARIHRSTESLAPWQPNDSYAPESLGSLGHNPCWGAVVNDNDFRLRRGMPPDAGQA